MSLMSVQGDLYRQLCEKAQPSTDDDRAFVKTHARAADSNRSNYVINKTCFKKLNELQPVEDSDSDPNASDGEGGRESGDSTGSRSGTGTNGGSGSNTEELTLVQVVRKLDPENDEHWTNDGKPAVKAVEAVFANTVTRAQIEEVAPGYDREAAKNAAE